MTFETIKYLVLVNNIWNNNLTHEHCVIFERADQWIIWLVPINIYITQRLKIGTKVKTMIRKPCVRVNADIF